MMEERKQTYTIRVPKTIAMRIDEVARNRGIAPTTLLQSIITRSFKAPEATDREAGALMETALAAKLETLRKRFDLVERNERIRFDQLRFEIVKTRAALFHSLDNTLGSDVVDQIIEAADQTAREYTSALNEPSENQR